MSNPLLIIAAEVIEKTAAYIDAVETEKDAAVSAERAKVAADLRTRYNEVTGEDISDEMAAKLAADKDVAALVEKLAGSSQAPDSMGGPGSVRDEPAEPRTKTEVVKAAEDRFAAWLSS